ncbi:hypothetical protein FQA39_LY15861 [Lamprigera yunnana]|nr:hypothetical protein FQA39_LY15861 [Lamprigera yunnana]
MNLFVVVLIVDLAALYGCNKTDCVNLKSCPGMEQHILNPNISMVDDLKSSICEIQEDGTITVRCKDYFNETSPNTAIHSNTAECGYEHSVYEFPWMAAFVAFGWSFCSGALINERYVLTSASCASDRIGDYIEIMLGDLNLLNDNCSEHDANVNEQECFNFEKYKIEKTVPHPLYNRTFNDIGLIRLERKVQFKEYIRPICLPSNSYIYSQTEDLLKTSGFLVHHDLILKKNQYKRNIDSRFVNLELCRKFLKGHNTSIRLTMYNTCSQDEPFHINYFVDHGGPIMNLYNDQWYVESLLSVAYDVVDTHRPIINTNRQSILHTWYAVIWGELDFLESLESFDIVIVEFDINVILTSVRAKSTADFFPEIAGNLSAITWAHAVNSQSLLKAALDDATMMIEADVVCGKLNAGGNDIPIMAHPPNVISDLSLEDFLIKVNNFNSKSSSRKGIKLDFKSTTSLASSKEIIKTNYSTFNFPVWINADIFPGPLNTVDDPVDADKFFEIAKTFENATLSIGWTTLYGGNITNANYTEDQIKNMTDFINRNNINQPITFPVRAGIAAQSIKQLTKLASDLPNSTFTLWSGIEDSVDIQSLRILIKDITVKRVYVDVPQALQDELHLDQLGGSGNIKPLAVLSLFLIVLVLSF